MPVASSDISAATSLYLGRHPDERPGLAPLLAELDNGTDLTSSFALPGHVTCSAVAVNEHGLMLVIWHRTLGLWLQPGGHLDPADASLVDAARRELAEETGVVAVAGLDPSADEQMPFHIDVHPIPANPARDMPAHWHADFMYAFAVQDPAVRLQPDEVSAYDWRPLEGMFSPPWLAARFGSGRARRDS